ncbi:MAG: hypothetical protein AAFW73_26775 [Bacteroidota bacterium]
MLTTLVLSFTLPCYAQQLILLFSLLGLLLFLRGLTSPALSLVLALLCLLCYQPVAWLPHPWGDPHYPMMNKSVNVSIREEGFKLREKIKMELALWGGINFRPRIDEGRADFHLAVVASGKLQSSLNETHGRYEYYYPVGSLRFVLDGWACERLDRSLPAIGEGQGLSKSEAKKQRDQQIEALLTDNLQRIGRDLHRCFAGQLK